VTAFDYGNAEKRGNGIEDEACTSLITKRRGATGAKGVLIFELRDGKPGIEKKEKRAHSHIFCLNAGKEENRQFWFPSGRWVVERKKGGKAQV